MRLVLFKRSSKRWEATIQDKDYELTLTTARHLGNGSGGLWHVWQYGSPVGEAKRTFLAALEFAIAHSQGAN